MTLHITGRAVDEAVVCFLKTAADGDAGAGAGRQPLPAFGGGLAGAALGERRAPRPQDPHLIARRCNDAADRADALERLFLAAGFVRAVGGQPLELRESRCAAP